MEMSLDNASPSEPFVPQFDDKTLARFNWVDGVDTAPPEQRAWAMEVYARLIKEHGEVQRVPRREPMHELISTMLSHRTTGANEDLAYARMVERFPSWHSVRDAPVAELAAAIAPSNFPEAKAPNIQKALRYILDQRPDADLSFLESCPLRNALVWLTALPGVGVKTATLTLLFCFGRAVIPVDTHLHRVCGRVGLIGPKITPEAAHAVLLSLLPADDHILYNFHIAMLRHGQKICLWKGPRCARCPLATICNYGRDALGITDEPARA
jgi:endonuclease-3